MALIQGLPAICFILALNTFRNKTKIRWCSPENRKSPFPSWISRWAFQSLAPRRSFHEQPPAVNNWFLMGFADPSEGCRVAAYFMFCKFYFLSFLNSMFYSSSWSCYLVARRFVLLRVVTLFKRNEPCLANKLIRPGHEMERWGEDFPRGNVHSKIPDMFDTSAVFQ